MRDVLKVVGFMLGVSVAAFIVCISVIHGCEVYGAKDERTPFIRNYDYGQQFLKAKTKRGTNYRKGIVLMHERYGPWCWENMPDDYIMCLSRIWLESRGVDCSMTNDSYLLEAALTSVSYNWAKRVCAEHGVCGDPCYDPEFSIALTALQSGMKHERLMYEECPEGAAIKCWSDWLPQQYEDSRIEAEIIMGICGGTNCFKIKKAFAIADQEVRKKGSKPHLPGGIYDHPHSFYKLMQWLREKPNGYILWLFDPLPVAGMKKFGLRWGRAVYRWPLTAEFFEPLPDGSPNYCWGSDPANYPAEPEVILIPGVGPYVKDIVPVLPKPLHPYSRYKFPSPAQWRSACNLHGSPPWHKCTGEPKRNDRWKKGGFNYDPITGEPIKVKKGAKKFASDEEYEAAWEVWKDSMQAQGRLPTDEEYATWEQKMAEAGCAFRNPLFDEGYEQDQVN